VRVGVAIVLVLVVAGEGRGDEPAATPAELQALYDEGTRRYNLGEYDAALESWRKAYLLGGGPGVLFNMGQAYRLKGDCENARTTYKAYLREAKDVPNRADVEQLMSACQEKGASSQPAATRPAAPASRPAAAPPVAPRAPVSPPPDEGTERAWRVAALSSAGLGAVAWGVGTVLGWRARSRWHDAQEDCTAATVCGPRGYDAAVEANDAARAANISFAVGLAAVAAGAVLWWQAPRARPARSAWHLGPGGVGWTVVF